MSRRKDDEIEARFGSAKVPSGSAGPLFDFDFQGADYRPPVDHDRLAHGCAQTISCMRDGTWRTKGEIRAAIAAAGGGDVIEESIGRYLRYAREPAWGAWTVERRRRGDPAGGLFEYRLLPGGKPLDCAPARADDPSG